MDGTTTLYTPKQMLKAMKEMVRPDSFLRDRYITGTETTDKKYIELDKVASRQGIAVYNSRTGEPTEVKKQGYDTDIHVAPYIDEVITMTPSDTDTREPGNTIYEDNASSNKAAKTVAYLNELQDRLDRLEERQVFECLKEGKVPVQNTVTGVNYTVDYNMPAGNKIALTGDDVWGGNDSAILANIEAWAQILSEQGYVAADLLLDIKAAALYRADSDILALLDNRRVEMGQLEMQRLKQMRASWLGQLDAVGVNVNVYCYFGGYETAESTFSRYMDDNRAIMVGAGLEIEQHYAKIENFGSNFVGRRFPNQWGDSGRGKIQYIGMESSPLAVMRNPKAVVSAKVVPDA